MFYNFMWPWERNKVLRSYIGKTVIISTNKENYGTAYGGRFIDYDNEFITLRSHVVKSFISNEDLTIKIEELEKEGKGRKFSLPRILIRNIEEIDDALEISEV